MFTPEIRLPSGARFIAPLTHEVHMKSSTGDSRLKTVVVTLLAPPLTNGFSRVRSLSNTSLRSRPSTPASSMPSTPTCGSPRSSDELLNPSPFVQAMIVATPYLAPSDILSASATTRRCRDLRTVLTYRTWLEKNGWDVGALERRTEAERCTGGRPWLTMARSAIQKESILERFQFLQNQRSASSKENKHIKKAADKLTKILMNAVTEHDNRNFAKLISLAKTLHRTFLQFVADIPADSWKIRYNKTFLLAAYVNNYKLLDVEGDEEDLEEDVVKVVESVKLTEVDTSPAFKASHDNFLYTFACMAYKDVRPQPLPSIYYDPPHHSLSFRSDSVPGLRQAAQRYVNPIMTKGTYRKANGDESLMNMDFKPGEQSSLKSRLSIPFVDKHQVPITATVSDNLGSDPWEMTGSMNLETGRGCVKSQQGMVYDLRTTPWGIVGEKLMSDKHLGYFVLQWI